ncbi:MAG TPA: ABC transporter ATP-binding protein [Tepidiformaceae bacterium]|nr:ABC transporter ATP-binding protein [Tepidiformaceae bacterium]
MTPPAILCEHVSKRFGATIAVDTASLTVAEREIVALLGPSGCGKTTLLRLIAGFEHPDSGTVTVGGALVAGGKTFVPPERRKIGMVFQDYALFPHMTVAKNVGYGVERGARERRVSAVLDLVGLSGLGERYPHELSGGQAQRVALARALAPEPAVVLFDEPFSNLDSRLRVSLRAEIRRILKDAGAAALFVTHDQEEAFSLADRVAVMWEGKVIQSGRPSDVYRVPQTRELATFLGDADFLPGAATGGRVQTEIGCVDVGAGPREGDVDVMLRPETLSIRPGGGDAVVVGTEFFGHDQLVAVKLPSGRAIHVRVGPEYDLADGEHVTVRTEAQVVTFEPVARR